MIAPPGFFYYRWRPSAAPVGFDDVAVVFKVPGSVDMAVLPDLVEDVCRGPLVPSAVVFVHLEGDESLVEAINSEPTDGALLRFDGRLPLVVVGVNLRNFEVSLSKTRGVVRRQIPQVRRLLSMPDHWLDAGLAAVFKSEVIVVSAPAGYVFHKPSNRRSGHFIRAELALTTSGAVSFVALAIFRRLLANHAGLPTGLKVLFVDTMSVATTAFALRELLSQAGLSPLPQIDSFHSYGGMEGVVDPLPGASLCIISASSSMNLHKEWTQQKRLSDRDALTLVTFDDAKDKAFALYAMPSSERPDEPTATAKHDIRIAGENFFPVIEPPRKVLLTTTKHACPQYTKVFHDLREQGVFRIFGATAASPTRRSLFIDGAALLSTKDFQCWVNAKLPHWLKAGTSQVIFQDDIFSRTLAEHIAYILLQLGNSTPKVVSFGDVSAHNIDSNGAIVCVAAVASRGNALLSLSRELRNVHRGPRLYVIGAQVTESESKLTTFDSNLRYSSSGACIDVLRKHTCLMDSSVGESLAAELAMINSQHGSDAPPTTLTERATALRKGQEGVFKSILLPSGHDLNEVLTLNDGFAFWPKDYAAGAFHAEVIGTVSALLQNARTSTAVAVGDRLRSPMLLQVALDPENFARFNDGVIQASILRTALPSELDYRGDADASAFMRTFLDRMASQMGKPQQAELEFLTALAIGRLRLNEADLDLTRKGFMHACAGKRSPMARAVRFLLHRLPSQVTDRAAF